MGRHIMLITNNYRAVSVGTDTEGNWAISGHFNAYSAGGAWQNTQVIYSRLKGTL